MAAEGPSLPPDFRVTSIMSYMEIAFLSSRSLFLLLVPVKSLLQFHIVQNVSSLPRRRRSDFVPPRAPPPRCPPHILKSRVNDTRKEVLSLLYKWVRNPWRRAKWSFLQRRYESCVCFPPCCVSAQTTACESENSVYQLWFWHLFSAETESQWSEFSCHGDFFKDQQFSLLFSLEYIFIEKEQHIHQISVCVRFFNTYIYIDICMYVWVCQVVLLQQEWSATTSSCWCLQVRLTQEAVAVQRNLVGHWLMR